MKAIRFIVQHTPEAAGAPVFDEGGVYWFRNSTAEYFCGRGVAEPSPDTKPPIYKDLAESVSGYPKAMRHWVLTPQTESELSIQSAEWSAAHPEPKAQRPDGNIAGGPANVAGSGGGSGSGSVPNPSRGPGRPPGSGNRNQ